MSKLILVIIAFAMVGCSSLSDEELALERQKLAIMQAAIQQPTIKCEQGCEYTDPRRNLAALFPKETTWADVGNTFAKGLTSQIPSLLMGGALIKSIDEIGAVAIAGMTNAGGNYEYNNSYNEHSEQNSSDTTTTTTETTTTETNTTTTTTDSNNDSSDNSTTTTTTETSTQTDDNSDNSTTTTTTEAPDGNT